MKKQKLIRVDIDLKYLTFVDEKSEYTHQDVLTWLHDLHSGELDADEDGERITITEVTEKIQVEDFDIDYGIYNSDNEETLRQCIENHGLDANEMIAKLKKLTV